MEQQIIKRWTNRYVEAGWVGIGGRHCHLIQLADGSFTFQYLDTGEHQTFSITDFSGFVGDGLLLSTYHIIPIDEGL